MTSKPDNAKSTTAAEPVELLIEPLDAGAMAGIDVPLKKMPLKINGAPLKAIHVPVRLTEELEALSKAVGAGGGMPRIVAAYCGIDIRIVGKLHPDDFNDLQEAVIDFLPRFIRDAMEDAKASAMAAAMAAAEEQPDAA